ncbi:MAG: PilT/PilU family type 4a pilus ATPase [Candidatus Eremiobacteraeota bacterium]|nr:PilT/PilU family type 4a pilus ATPase [Candidatus Eremiobacteraeota bacterium]
MEDHSEFDKLAEDATKELEKSFHDSRMKSLEKKEQPTESKGEEKSEFEYDLTDLLQVVRKYNASDLHIKEGSPPIIRIHSELFPVGEYRLTSEDCQKLIFEVCNRSQFERLISGKEIDIAYSDGGTRFRISAFLQKSTFSAAIRMLQTEIPKFEALNLPTELSELVSHKHGLVLVTGPAGTGKSTTLAAMVDHINEKSAKHIITIEDPIEYLHISKKSLISQREVGSDTLSFFTGLKNALRQDPDVILIGEIRSPETIMIATQAAETGHLILSTLHTPNAVQSINRLLDVFSGDVQKQMRLLLANNLRGVVSQRLINRIDGEGLVPAIEILTITSTIASLIVEGKVGDIYQFMKQGKLEGMITLNQSLYDLYEKGMISYEDALYNSDESTELKMMMDGHMSRPSIADDDTLVSWI